MKKIAVLSILILFVSTFVYQTAFADNVVVNVTVPQARTMTVPASINISGIVGSEATQTLAITGIKTNCPWTLSVKKDSTFNAGNGDLYSATTSHTINSTKFLFTSTTQTTPVEFLTTDTTVNSGLKTGDVGTNENVVYRLSVTYDDDAAADYQARHIYTLGA